MKLIFSVIALSILVSCKHQTTDSTDVGQTEIVSKQDPKSTAYFDRIFLPEEVGIFRAVGFDQTQQAVSSRESDGNLTLREEKTGFLQYDTDLERDTSSGIDYAEVKYIFDEFDRLDIITVNYYIQDSSITNDLYDLLNHRFTDNYGDYYIDSDGYTVWESTYARPDSTDVIFDIGIRKLVKINDPGITIELMRFGTL